MLAFAWCTSWIADSRLFITVWQTNHERKSERRSGLRQPRPHSSFQLVARQAWTRTSTTYLHSVHFPRLVPDNRHVHREDLVQLRQRYHPNEAYTVTIVARSERLMARTPTWSWYMFDTVSKLSPAACPPVTQSLRCISRFLAFKPPPSFAVTFRTHAPLRAASSRRPASRARKAQ